MARKIERAQLPYRPCVGVMLVARDNRVFIGRRLNKRQPEHVAPGHEWQMPQGGIDPGEEPYAAALRELAEETNVRSVSLIAEAPDWYTYELPDEIISKSWRGGYRGQKQKWFALRFEGAESEIDIRDPGPGHKPEFDAWRWEDVRRLPELIIPFKRPVYENVVKAFAPLLDA
ncbi:MAG: RNA pyrophosphohydrolase [Hyphomicrobiales bacterium]|nr:RNA pyrophosphohydrolase [Hyphomicrobiales bacterium]